MRPGQRATVRLEAFPELRLTGKVTRVGTLARTSADRPFDDKRFDLIVELDEADAELRPEMTARADILLGERPGVLLVPINAVFDQQGPVCHVVGPAGFETRRVRLGESSDADVEVIGGLREGERVSLVDTTGANVPVQPASDKGASKAGASKNRDGSASPLAPR